MDNQSYLIYNLNQNWIFNSGKSIVSNGSEDFILTKKETSFKISKIHTKREMTANTILITINSNHINTSSTNTSKKTITKKIPKNNNTIYKKCNI